MISRAQLIAEFEVSDVATLVGDYAMYVSF